MASGDLVVQILEDMGPATLFAPLGARAGGSTPAESVGFWGFDADVPWYRDFKIVLIGYGGNGLTISLPYMMASATADEVVWDAAIRRWADDAEDIDGSHTYVWQSVTDTVANVSGEISIPVITFTNGSQMDSLADGEFGILRIARDADEGADNALGDAQLIAVIGKET